ncbi:alpha-amylase family glycosyl hydrolase [Cytophagaceae bacterium ABcell3]|nr:alpha-amylase family glycosyl hydrolase [Cytophagaceae bacterium ABcell3]
MLDVVINHTSIYHPYAQHCIKKGSKSRYYDYYQQRKDSKPYASFYKKTKAGFIVYFWEDLVNLNYDNPKVQYWILNHLKHWVNKYDIDGYRFDAIWGVLARNPDFIKTMNQELKKLNPDLLLLAEAKGADLGIYQAGFDAAYDWTADTNWVSQWVWEYDYASGTTIFNNPDPEKAAHIFKNSIFSSQYPHRKLRFIENNDHARFIEQHGAAKTKMAAALIFSLPGMPMLYNGQEIGVDIHPYDGAATFERNKKIRTQGDTSLYEFYQTLISLRKAHPS